MGDINLGCCTWQQIINFHLCQESWNYLTMKSSFSLYGHSQRKWLIPEIHLLVQLCKYSQEKPVTLNKEFACFQTQKLEKETQSSVENKPFKAFFHSSLSHKSFVFVMTIWSKLLMWNILCSLYSLSAGIEWGRNLKLFIEPEITQRQMIWEYLTDLKE